MTNDPTLKELAAVVAEWVDGQPVIKNAFLFGSRTRGDYNNDSDVDLYIEFVDFPVEQDMRRWATENDVGFVNFKAKLPGRLSLHTRPDDAALPQIRKGSHSPILSVGKVICVVTPQRFC